MGAIALNAATLHAVKVPARPAVKAKRKPGGGACDACGEGVMPQQAVSSVNADIIIDQLR
jgi:hypothetical protein